MTTQDDPMLRARRSLERGMEGGTVVPGFVSNMLRHSLWALALRGILAIALGALALLQPDITLAAFLSATGVYLIIDGLFTLISGFRAARKEERYWPLLLEGALSMGVGVLAFARPLAFAVGVLIMVAVRCIVTGSAEIALGNSLRKETGIKDWALWIAGGVSVLFGILLLASPGAGVATLIWLGGVYALIFGAALIGSAIRLRSLFGPLGVA